MSNTTNTTNTKHETIERMARKFTELKDTETKSYAVMCMTAYEAGKEAGRQEILDQQTA